MAEKTNVLIYMKNINPCYTKGARIRSHMLALFSYSFFGSTNYFCIRRTIDQSVVLMLSNTQFEKNTQNTRYTNMSVRGNKRNCGICMVIVAEKCLKYVRAICICESFLSIREE